jgi:hypothetical protein
METNQPVEQSPDRFSAWSKPVTALKFPDLTGPGVTNLNVDGRRVNGPLQGFGQLWQKTFRVRLTNPGLAPQQVIQALKENFPRFHARQNHFYTSSVGIAPGEVMLINAMTPFGPVSTGMLVMYVDDESFTLISPEGHPESGWVTFSAFEDGDDLIAQVQTQARANDPVYELGFMVLGTKMQDSIWTAVLQSLAKNFGSADAEVEKNKLLLDNHRQWSQAKNVWQNASLRTMIYWIGTPLRSAAGLFKRKSG